MNLLLAQVDMIVIEISSNLLMSCIITRYYLNYKVKTDTTTTEDATILDETAVYNIILNNNNLKTFF